jgi:hypothetical protein
MMRKANVHSQKGHGTYWVTAYKGKSFKTFGTPHTKQEANARAKTLVRSGKFDFCQITKLDSVVEKGE